MTQGKIAPDKIIYKKHGLGKIDRGKNDTRKNGSENNWDQKK